MQQLTVNSPEVALLAKELRPDAKKLTNNDKGCAFTLIILKTDISKTKNGGEKVYSFIEAAKLRHPDYGDVGTGTQAGHVADIRNFGLRLTNMSSLPRGSTAIGIVMMNDATAKLHKTAKKTGVVPTVAEIAATYQRWLPYTHIAAFGDLNGNWLLGWDEAQRYSGQQKADKAVTRAKGWKAAEIASPEAVNQLGVLSELALQKAATKKLASKSYFKKYEAAKKASEEKKAA